MKLRLVALIALSATTAASAGVGPLDSLYLTSGDDNALVIIQGSSYTRLPQNGISPGVGDEYAIAVGSTVRTLANGNQGTIPTTLYGLGSEYTLAGTPTGTTYAYPNVDYFYDGTTDGTHNYAAGYGSGYIWQFNTDWTNPVALFSTVGSALGITYDSRDNTLWVASYASTTLNEYSMTGTLLNSFSTAAAIGFVAYDPGDNSLWIGGIDNPNIYQYDTSGNLLQSAFYEGLGNLNVLGGEFAENGGQVATPEPATMATAGLGILFAGLTVARRRKTA